ncbi:tetratricopeptide repeat protein [Mahella australiensis]|uniref:Tetratricopeptide TPR_1 repeat-containing protein n=1 Tax=Mahella australiensis (strain DSM 15567 / CIP 107919 / 50-1 BON) TaxID=697281 RepID=F3ZYX3_MAHA5|nr:tetratricopeptide repeat protein [Mahella australiensis]AEE95718.1 hypothetical protein Mahau_0505 [Mahella australiensis 50-1 BON]
MAYTIDKRIIYSVIIAVIIAGILGITAINHMAESRYNDPEYAQMYKTDELIRRMEIYIQNNPEDIDAIYELALRYFRDKRQYEKADALLKKALQIDPDNTEIMSLRATVMENSGALDDAEKQLRDILTINPNDGVIWSRLSQLLFVSDRKQSLVCAQKALDIVKNSGGDIKHYADWIEALTLFEKDVRSKPAEAFMRILDFYVAQERLQLEICDMALKYIDDVDVSGITPILEKKGKLEIYYNDNENAVQTFLKLIDINPQYGYGYILLGDRLSIMGKTTELEELDRRVLLLGNDTPEKKIIDAMLLEANGLTVESIKAMEGLLGQGKYKDVIRYHLGMMYQQTGDNGKALECFYLLLKSTDKTDFDYINAIKYDVDSRRESLLY